MDQVVIDASVAIKWVYSEDLSAEAVALRKRYEFSAPDLLLAECANILWKMVRRKEMSEDEAIFSMTALRRAGVELAPASELAIGAVSFAVALDHPAYDCFYLELCRRRELRLITADERLIRKLKQSKSPNLPKVILLSDIV